MVCLGPSIPYAQTGFDESMEKNDPAQDHLRLGIDFFLSDELEVAIDEFREAARLRQGYADAYHNLGVALAKSGDLSGAIAAWSQAQRLRSLPEAHSLSSFSLGVLQLWYFSCPRGKN